MSSLMNSLQSTRTETLNGFLQNVAAIFALPDQPDQAGQEREERGEESNNSPRGDGAWRGGVDEDEDEDEDEEEQKLKTERLQPRLCVICLERPPGPFLGGSACMVCTFGENHELE